MVLNVEDLQRDFGLSREESEAMRSRRELYSFMHGKRLACHHSDLAKRKEHVAESESVHYRTLACKEALKSVSNEAKRREISSFFDELNDLGESRSFAHSVLKDTMIAERKRRYEEFKEEDRKKRSVARATMLLEASIADKKRLETRERLKGENLSHSSVLGLEHGSSVEDVEFAFRAQSILFHPDKCKDADAADILQKLQEAYDVLSRDEKCAVYDAENSWCRPRHQRHREMSNFSD
jgi:DnaJ domain